MRCAGRAYAHAQVLQAQGLGVPLSLAIIDLDHFKAVNDSLGHAGGDQVLKAFAAAATSVLRGQDRLGRWGGEEWLLVLPGTAVEELPAVFERLRTRFATASVEGLAGPHGCTFSMGAAQLGTRIAGLDELIAEADLQLYRAKHEGRNRLCTA
jgi:diguanylate cyclase (GGDEF)-like protein